MNRQALIERVKIKLDEYTTVDEGVSHPLDVYIDPALDEAAKTLILDFPINKLKHESYTGSVTSVGTTQVILFPSSVKRVVSVRFQSWKRAVTEFFLEGSKQAAMQGNVHTQGNDYKPVAILTQRNGAYELVCHTATDAVSPEIKVVSAQKPEQLHEDLVEPLVFLAASYVAQSTERDKAFQLLRAEYQKYFS